MDPFRHRSLTHELAGLVGSDHVLVDEIDRLAYAVDYYWVPRMLVDRGEKPPLPDVVVLPGTTAEVAELLAFANRERLPVVPWGGGSGTQGGVMPLHGGMTIDLKRLDRVVDVDTTSLTVTAQAGVNGYALERAVQAHGLMLAHYPASVHAATLGGYLAARGSGVLSTKYGKAEDLVLSIEVVLPRGEVIRTLPVPSHAAGPGLLPLFVGAEGSFGIITEATMQLEPIPQERRFRALLFEDVGRGLEAGRRIVAARLGPSVLRLYDEASTQSIAARTLGLTIPAGAYLVVGFEGEPGIVEAQEEAACRIAFDLGATDLGSEPGRQWWDHRYDFYFPPHAIDLPTMYGTTDTVAPFGAIDRLWRAKKERLESRFARWDLEYIAHFSHWFPWGVMVYDRFIVPQPPDDAGEALALHDDIWDVSVRTSLEFGGVINEHHGVGAKLARWMRPQYGPAFQVVEAVKHSLDPDLVLNPGKMGFGPTR